MTSVALVHHIPSRARFKTTVLTEYPQTSEWIKRGLLSLQGVRRVRVNIYACSITVEYDTNLVSPEAVSQRFDALNWQQADHDDSEHELSRGDIALNLLGTLATIFLPSRLGALITLPLITPTVIKGVASLKENKIKVEALDALAVGLSTLRRDYRTAMITQSLLTLGEYMEQATSRNTDQLLAELMEPNSYPVWVERDGEHYQISSAMLCQNDKLLLSPGDPIPADGTILTGTGLINQASLTGESVPVRREPNSYVYAGTVVQDGNICVRAEKIGSEATTAQIAQLIMQSLDEKSETQQTTQKMADRRVKLTLGIGAIVFALTQDLNRLASVFLVDYSCSLKLTTPVTFKAIMYRAAKQGIVLKGGRAIEQLAEVDTCIFDKTGTLTYGDMEVTDVICLRDQDNARQLLAIASSVEEHCNHPLSQAIVNTAANYKLPHIEHGEVQYILAHGLRSTMSGHELMIGSRHFLEAHEKVDFSPYETQIAALKEKGRHTLFVSKDHNLVGIIGLQDHVRAETKETLQRLRDSGIKHLVMLTGDSRAKGEQIGAELGMDMVFAETTPESKAQIVDMLHQYGHRILFVGDGVNDAPALTNADVGIAMAKATDLAQQSADIVLLQDNLSAVATVRQMSQEALQLIQSNIRIAEVVNSGIMLAAATGFLNPALSTLLHNGTTIAVLLRALSARGD